MIDLEKSLRERKKKQQKENRLMNKVLLFTAFGIGLIALIGGVIQCFDYAGSSDWPKAQASIQKIEISIFTKIKSSTDISREGLASSEKYGLFLHIDYSFQKYTYRKRRRVYDSDAERGCLEYSEAMGYKVGQKVEVRVNPKEPSMVIVGGEPSKTAEGFYYILIGLFHIGIGFFLKTVGFAPREAAS